MEAIFREILASPRAQHAVAVRGEGAAQVAQNGAEAKAVEHRVQTDGPRGTTNNTKTDRQTTMKATETEEGSATVVAEWVHEIEMLRMLDDMMHARHGPRDGHRRRRHRAGDGHRHGLRHRHSLLPGPAHGGRRGRGTMRRDGRRRVQLSASLLNGSLPSAHGFGYAAGHRTDLTGVGSPNKLCVFHIMNPSSRAARTRDGYDVGIRVITIHNEVATGVNSLFSNNHVLPMLSEFQFEDIIFGIFPVVGFELRDLYGYWAQNSAGDIVEALAFIHKLNIAHRDAFKDNFLIQYHAESLKTMSILPSRPRVFLIDFEVAIEFPPECPVEEQVVTGIPAGGSFRNDGYTRPHAPEYISGKPYSPFKLDIWQMASSLTDVRSTIPGIGKVLDEMYSTNPDERPHAQEALDRIRSVVNSLPPQSLLIAPWMEDDWLAEMEAEEPQLQELKKD
ncbi:hypothetical protein BJ912DRAFT_1109354 [Pholiota molesta]|nr:hypothetical protein BJ912DRAFT_1109354 [Pholiota molesta]